MIVMSARSFYEASGRDSRIDKDAVNPVEKQLYNAIRFADKDDNGVTYDEYLEYVSNIAKTHKLPIIILDVENPDIRHDTTSLGSGTILTNTEIEGFSLKAGDHVIFLEDKLFTIIPAADREIRGFPCKAGQKVIIFDGKITALVLSKDFEIEGSLCKANKRVYFDGAGKRIWK